MIIHFYLEELHMKHSLKSRVILHNRLLIVCLILFQGSSSFHKIYHEQKTVVRLPVSVDEFQMLPCDTNCSSLSFPNIRRNESGKYICRVFMDIPYYVSTKDGSPSGGRTRDRR
uniref:Uncharacterized protein n=1 Tax=Stegastes partitus TaxID=144197 RepID=A0A3B5A3D5_9TELE